MVKQIVFIIFIALSSNIFTMLYDEDSSIIYAAQGHTAEVIKLINIKAIIPSTNQKKNRSGCLSILQSLIQQYEHAIPLGFVNLQ